MRRDQESPSEAIGVTLKGLDSLASSREPPSDDAGLPVLAQQGQVKVAPSSPPFPSEVSKLLPQGQFQHASSREPALLGEAEDQMPQGQKLLASSEQSEFPSEARRRAPQGPASSASSREPESSDAGQPGAARNGQARLASSLPPDEDAEAISAVPQGPAPHAPVSSPNGDDGHRDRALDGQSRPAVVPDVYDFIQMHHRQRNYVMESRKIVDLRLLSFLRTQLGWQREKPEAERERIKTQALALLKMGELEAKGKPVDTDEPAYLEWHDVIMASVHSRASFDVLEKQATKEMEKLAKTLPVWKSFGEEISGFGARSLAVIVGEAGDLGQYATHSKLWKRMGLAVMNGKRQGGLPKGAPKEEWTAHGYNRQRRSTMFVIGKAMVKQQSRYREIYLARKEYERRKAEAAGLIVAPAAKIPKKRAAEFMSLGHIDKRAQRYMEKKLLRDLWRAWRNDPEARCFLSS